METVQTDNKPLVSVVNVTWNGRRLLEKHLPSLKRLRYPNYEVIIVDNGSGDGNGRSVREIKHAYKSINQIWRIRNIGV